MKLSSKILSFSAAAALAASAAPWSAFAESEYGQVRVIVENYNFTDDSAAWSGELMDVWVDIDENSTALSAAAEAIEAEGYTITGADVGYVTDINGVGTETSAGGWSGWCCTLNDWITSEGIGSYTVAGGTLEDGDEICFKYTIDWGADVGSDWASNDTTLIDLEFSTGTLDKEFDPSVSEYTLTIDDGSEGVFVTPTAANKNFQVRTYKSNYTPDIKGSEFKRSEEIPVADGDKLYIGVGNTAWPTMNSGQTETVYTINIAADNSSDDQAAAEEVDMLIEAIGEVTADSAEAIEAARAAYERLTDEQKELCQNYQLLLDAEEAFAQLEQPQEQIKAFGEIFDETTKYLLEGDAPSVGSIGGEWTVIGLARSGELTAEFAKGYYENAVKYISDIGSSKLDRSKSTENSRLVLALTSIGCDASDIEGYNLLEPLADFDFVKKQGINGPAWALIAFDSAEYEIPETNAENPATREKLVQYIIDAQLSDGSWALDGENSDIDTTAMMITALVPYSVENEDAASAVDKAVEWLSSVQNEDGSFGINGKASCETTAQVIVALSAAGIDSANDERFVKNELSVCDALCGFYVGNGQFASSMGSAENRLATEQAYYAMTAYDRFANGEYSLFDMTDAGLTIFEPIYTIDVVKPDNLDDVVDNDIKINIPDAGEELIPKNENDPLPDTGAAAGSGLLAAAVCSLFAALRRKNK